jgi:hypothetical protein
LNGDPSNFWIFSPSGLRRLLKRTNWTMVSHYTVGAAGESNPWSLDGDERMFCFVESTYGFPKVELVSGWHNPEGSGWRWTEREFSANLEVPKGTGSRLVLALEMYIPAPVLNSLGPLTLSASVEGHAVADEPLLREGYHSYLRPLPSKLGNRNTLAVRFVLDKALPPEAEDHRERGVIVASLKVQRRG